MITNIYWITDNIATSPRPRGGEYLVDEVKNWASLGVNIVVSLLEKEEFIALHLEEEQQVCENNAIEYINFPIKDRQVPESYLRTLKIVHYLVQKISENKKVIVHCRAGIGRATLFATCLLIQQGRKVDEILETITEIRGLPVPDTIEQVHWLKEFEISSKQNL